MKQPKPKAAASEDMLAAMVRQLQADHDLAVTQQNAAAAVAADRALIDLLSLKMAGSPIGETNDPAGQVIRVIIGGGDSGRVSPTRADEDVASLASDSPASEADDSLARRLLALLDGDGNG